MATVLIQSDNASVIIDTLGAEVISYIKHGKQIMKDTNNYWDKTAPILFPFSGLTVDGLYSVNGVEYSAPKHGCARSSEFQLVETSNDKALLCYETDDYYAKLRLLVEYSFDYMEVLVLYWVTINTSLLYLLYTFYLFINNKNNNNISISNTIIKKRTIIIIKNPSVYTPRVRYNRTTPRAHPTPNI